MFIFHVVCSVQPSLGSSVSKSQGSINQPRDEKGAADNPSKPSRAAIPAVGAVGAAAGQIFAEIGLYKGVLIALKHIKKDHLQITRQVLLEFNDVSASVHLFSIHNI